MGYSGKLLRHNLSLENGVPRASEWGRRNLIGPLKLLFSNCSTSMNGYDKMALFTWIATKLQQIDGKPFVLGYWDLRPANILLNDENELTYSLLHLSLKARIIDWESVEAVPSNLSPATEIEMWFFNPQYIEAHTSFSHFHVTYADQFRETRERLQRQDIELRNAQLYESPIPSNEAFFIHYLLTWGLTEAISAFPELIRDAIRTATKDPGRISSEWQSFATEFYTSRGRPIPDWVQYIEIQEELGLIGTTRCHRIARRVKREAQIILKAVLDKVCILFPNWKEASRQRCQLIAATSHRYKLESGGYWCE